jgi:NAD-dependent SIR2 family protein deacetylase
VTSPRLEVLASLLRGRRVVALTGAGCSTESGIPDYRGPLPDGRPRPERQPIMFREFVSSAATRQRYWARAVIGWRAVASAQPNPAHRALAALEETGALAGVITQNVDGLHSAAGSRRLVELHGNLAQVRCLACGALGDRAALQERLLAKNPGWLEWAPRTERSPRETETRSPRMTPWAPAMAPDGDADLDGERVAAFAVEDCACGGPLKPDVVFFGENVPAAVVAEAWNLFDEAEALLVVGSSLAVFSGYRFARRAAERGIPVAIVNHGATRGDREATVKIEARAGELLPLLAARLS